MKNAVLNDMEIRIEHVFFMRERAYRQMDITDIAEAAGVGRATLYRYFKRKEESTDTQQNNFDTPENN